MFRAAALLAFTCLAMVSGQQAGTNTAENHPQLQSQQCTTSGGCKPLSTKVVLDSNWRWVHSTSGYTNCYTGNEWDCGLNGALYLSAMDADGGMSKYPGNKAGAKYGTGYCDSQCPKDIKFINGEANVGNWTETGSNTGTGSYGTCCSEMDIWEANNDAAAFTPHPCTTTGQTRCSGDDCARNTGLCDGDGCDFNSFRMGDKTFLGKGMTVDTSKPFTVVTQFLTNDNTSTGTLSEI
nr:cellulose 1,4-beta-cellobiosidase (EC 3.2.1.91) isoform cbh1-4 - basidiomycete (Phanerochaete chrysosporium) (fragments) [Phanerodontia chrysosporium]